MTKILGIEGIPEAARLIADGQVVAFPTETVYGLGGDAFSVSAINKIYQAKGRPSDNPLIVHISKVSDVYRVSDNVPPMFFKLADIFMPGPLTMVVPKGKSVPYEITAGLESVAVRMPSHPIAARIIEESGTLIAAPSANASKHISPTSAKHVFDDLNGKIPLIIDGGDCEVGIESTVLSLVTEIPTILRPGAVTEEMLAEVIGKVKNFSGKVIASAPAPGMKYRHYAPTSPAILSESTKNTKEKYDKISSEGKSVVVLTTADKLNEYKGMNCINMGVNGAEVAHNIYSALHRGEAYDIIIVDSLKGDGIDKSVMNRIFKATAE